MNLEAYEHYDALIFDMDGTLVDSGKLHENAWMVALETYGIPLDKKLMRGFAGVPTEKTIGHLIKHFDLNISATPAEINALKMDQVQKHLFDYVKPTALEAVVKHYYGKKPMAVGTGATTPSAQAILDACNLSQYMDFVVGADQVSAHKPAPDTFLLCAEKMRIEASKCVVFEDAKLGIEAAQSAGMDCVDVAKELDIHNDYFM